MSKDEQDDADRRLRSRQTLEREDTLELFHQLIGQSIVAHEKIEKHLVLGICLCFRDLGKEITHNTEAMFMLFQRHTAQLNTEQIRSLFCSVIERWFEVAKAGQPHLIIYSEHRFRRLEKLLEAEANIRNHIAHSYFEYPNGGEIRSGSLSHRKLQPHNEIISLRVDAQTRSKGDFRHSVYQRRDFLSFVGFQSRLIAFLDDLLFTIHDMGLPYENSMDPEFEEIIRKYFSEDLEQTIDQLYKLSQELKIRSPETGRSDWAVFSHS